MAFDLDNSVQQGFNRDIETNDWHVEAQNLEVKLGDAGGGTEFRVLDSDNVGVVVADSDGYLSVAGNAEVHGGHVLVRGESLTNTAFISLEDELDGVDVYLFDANPDGTISAAQGSFGTNYNDGYMYVNADGATQWERLAYVSQVPNLSGASTATLQSAYENGNTIATDAANGNVDISGTESVIITASGGLDVDTTGAISLDADLDSNFSVDAANLTFEVTTSGDIINRLASPGSDFVIDQGAGSEFLRAETSANVLRLGDLSPEQIDVQVLSDLIVDGDLTVQGTTTTVNTEDLFVEDRLMRLNVGAEPSFSGTTGIEMEVGSDGYVEFHWDDAQGRWEFSIDRNITPEAQTFRPIPYLADSPPTLDLSDTGDDGFPTAGPNLTGASAINTNSTNFPYSFGDYMADDSVQSALEAIDAYFIDLQQFNQTVTLQVAYDNDVDGGDATIITNSIDGAVVISGTEEFRVDATGGINLDTGFDMDSSTNDFDVDLTSGAAFHLDAYSPTSTPSIQVDSADLLIGTSTSGVLTLEGATGIVLDGSGEGVRPADDCVNDLGRSDAGWRELYICNSVNNTVALGGVGTQSDLPNTTSGASAVGTANENFVTFGPDMTDDTVQAALEAIDGYFATLSLDNLADTFYTKELGLSINGGILNGNVRISQDGIMPALDYKAGKTGRSCWTVPVPSDWDGVSDIYVEVVWSAIDATAGDVAWRVEYLPLAEGELASGAASTVDFTQAASGTADEIQATGTNLAIPGSAIDPTNDEIIGLCVVRRGTAGADTYTGDVQVHLVKYSYTAANIVE